MLSCGLVESAFSRYVLILTEQFEILQIEDYILRDDRDLPLLMVGEAGCGKSSVLCKLADALCTKLKQGLLKRYVLCILT